MSINFTKRLAGKEDILWDTDGSGTQSSYTDSLGNVQRITPVGAGTIPLNGTMCEVFGNNVKTVSDALAELNTRQLDMDDSAAWPAGQTYTLHSAAEATTLEETLRARPNLGGHDFYITIADGCTSLRLYNAYNGNINIMGGGVAAQTMTSLKLYNVLANVLVSDLSFPAGAGYVQLSNTPFVDFSLCEFAGGTSDSGKYAVTLDKSNCSFEECTQTGLAGLCTVAPGDARYDLLAVDNGAADIAALQAAMDDKAPLDSPSFSGSPTAPTTDSADNSTKLATTEFVQALVASAGNGQLGAPANGSGYLRLPNGLFLQYGKASRSFVVRSSDYYDNHIRQYLPFFTFPVTFSTLISIQANVVNSFYSPITICNPTANGFYPCVSLLHEDINRNRIDSGDSLTVEFFWFAIGIKEAAIA